MNDRIRYGSFARLSAPGLHILCRPDRPLGYFQKEIVERRDCCGAATLVEIIALDQSTNPYPGPAGELGLGLAFRAWAREGITTP